MSDGGLVGYSEYGSEWSRLKGESDAKENVEQR